MNGLSGSCVHIFTEDFFKVVKLLTRPHSGLGLDLRLKNRGLGQRGPERSPGLGFRLKLT
ncbi:hypothetical protein BpHYR1_026914 [Brachionus plicatilis]|uniref:Uncharacterized protein n=1 Tax=Brachionus plicatilis TaxID=10195 RepID=A0A3M7RNW1_BRAPC|nr:hypothetical protein BpHYR1_026914 [Brachionus plicatilis]